MSADLETCVQLVRDCGLPTGHAETHEELLREVLLEVEQLRRTVAAYKSALQRCVWTGDADLRRLDDEANAHR